jgi:hypothetical protein
MNQEQIDILRRAMHKLKAFSEIAEKRGQMKHAKELDQEWVVLSLAIRQFELELRAHNHHGGV